MKKKIKWVMHSLAILSLLSSCKKDEPHRPGTPPPVLDTFITVKIKAGIKVGNIMYDSIPVQFKITSWDRRGNIHTTDTMLAAGINQIRLNKSLGRYKFEIKKWNVIKDTAIRGEDLKETKLYSIVAAKSAKLLKEEINYSYISGGFHPMSKMTYSYVSDRLSEITFHQIFLTGGTEHFEAVKKEFFTYNGNRVNKIKEVYLMDVGTQASEKFYTYDPYNRIDKTNVVYPNYTFNYRNDYDKNGENTITVFIEGSHNPSATHYKLKFDNSNRIEITTIANQGSYTYLFTYDLNINPYVHLSWPDPLFTRQSKNNIATERFAINGEVSEDFKYEYQFDEEGYPSQIIQKERDPQTNEFQFKSKQEFHY